MLLEEADAPHERETHLVGVCAVIPQEPLATAINASETLTLGREFLVVLGQRVERVVEMEMPFGDAKPLDNVGAFDSTSDAGSRAMMEPVLRFFQFCQGQRVLATGVWATLEAL